LAGVDGWFLAIARVQAHGDLGVAGQLWEDFSDVEDGFRRRAPVAGPHPIWFKSAAMFQPVPIAGVEARTVLVTQLPVNPATGQVPVPEMAVDFDRPRVGF